MRPLTVLPLLQRALELAQRPVLVRLSDGLHRLDLLARVLERQLGLDERGDILRLRGRGGSENVRLR